MKSCLYFTLIFLVVAIPAVGGTGGGSESGFPDGILVLQPATSNNCLAIRVEVPGDQMLTGIRWFNGSGMCVFPQILASSGQDLFPPSNQQAMVMASDVGGLDNNWTTLSFDSPVASESGTLFVVFQYPANYVPGEGDMAHGLGYANQEDREYYFVSVDGDNWFKMSSRYKLMVEPLLAIREPSVVALSEVRPEKHEELPDPKQSMTLTAYPNPFNPEVKLEVFLPKASLTKVKIYDVRGRIVRSLFADELEPGTTVLGWDGRDEGGRRVSSGVYWAQVQTEERTMSKRVVMVK